MMVIWMMHSAFEACTRPNPYQNLNPDENGALSAKWIFHGTFELDSDAASALVGSTLERWRQSYRAFSVPNSEDLNLKSN